MYNINNIIVIDDDNSELSDNEDYYNTSTSTSSSEDDEMDDLNTRAQRPIINDQLSIWAVKHNVSNVVVNDLLNILRTHHSCFKNLPKDSRTLLKTSMSSKTIEVKSVAPGSYYHFGITRSIKHFYNDFENHMNNNSIHLVFGIDGLPLTGSSSSCFWPILCYIKPYKETVFPVGIYWGYKKPEDSNLFLVEFYEELSNLITNGITFNTTDNKKTIFKQVILDTIVCDAPAKSFVLKIKGHSGFFSCTRCETQGIYKKNRLCFPAVNEVKRTHESFIRKMQEKHHLANTEMSILINLPNINIINVFSLDYMHLVCLGVTKKLLKLWLFPKSKGPKHLRINPTKLKELNSNIINLKSCITSDFPRKPRSLDDLSNWKATEFRQFILYIGPIVLKNIINDRCYLNFLCLHTCMTILLSPNLNKMINFCDKLLKYFINEFCLIYGAEHASHNLHALQHLIDDYNHFGPLDNASAFPFENHMRILKKTVRKAAQPLQQAVKRYEEKMKFQMCCTNNSDPVLKKPHTNGPLMHNLVNPQYHILIFKTFKISTTLDNYVFTKFKQIIKIENICHDKSGSIVIIGKSFSTQKAFYNKPVDSTNLGIYVIDNLSIKYEYYNIHDIECKYMVLKLNNQQIGFPILHTSSNTF